MDQRLSNGERGMKKCRENDLLALSWRKSRFFFASKNPYSYLADKLPGLTFAVLPGNHKTGTKISENMANHSANKERCSPVCKTS
jgi:hypothetical protein